MLSIRGISAPELHSFSQFAACHDRGFAPSIPQEFERWLDALWQSGQCAPDCCFVAEQDQQMIAAAVYWLRGNAAHLEHLQCPTDDPGVLTALVTESLRLMETRGTSSVWAELPSPPLLEPRLSIIKDTLERCGFGIGLERLTFIWTQGPHFQPIPSRLTFRNLNDVGKQAFLNALADLSADSLDAGMSADRKAKGPLNYAIEEFADQALTRHEPSWWQIAYNTTGVAIGILLLGIVGRQPAVLLIAIHPEHRGHHYSRDLLIQAISTLQPAWMSDPEKQLKHSIRGDVDLQNHPMVQAFCNVGFKQVRSSLRYEQHLRSP